MRTTIKPIFFLISTLLYFSSLSQLKTVYDFQKDDSVLKKAYYSQALENNNKLISSLKEYKKDYQEIYNARFKEVTDLLQSSRAVTDHEANDYLQAVLKKIGDANPELKIKEVRLIFSR